MCSELIIEPMCFCVTSICLILFMEPWETLPSGKRKVKFLCVTCFLVGEGEDTYGKESSDAFPNHAC